jgi:hypothetical protein
VLLTAAVDRLAPARLTAGQANDDGKHAAQMELRGEFYRDTISPLVVSRSGKNYKIRPYHWGNDELAPTWFEQGECLLTDGLVDPPLRMFQGEERAYIFVPEHDLQRLMAKQEVKQVTRLAEAKIEPEFRRWRENIRTAIFQRRAKTLRI